jgi:hypothetical protein
MHGAISNEDTSCGTKNKLACVIWTKVRPTSTTKRAKSIIIGGNMKETFSGRLKINNLAREQIYEKSCSEKSFIPIFKRHRGIGKQGKTNFNYMTVFSFSGTILLVSMWA